MNKCRKWVEIIGLIAVFIIICCNEVGAKEVGNTTMTTVRPSMCAKLFDDDQIKALRFSYQRGNEYDMGWTLAAIAWQESVAGKYPVNWNDPSYGLYHVLLKTAAGHKGIDIKEEPHRAQAIATQLLYDWNYAADHAIEVLLYWHSYHDGDWMRTWASYNAGFNHSRGKAYAESIANKIKTLKSKCANEIVR